MCPISGTQALILLMHRGSTKKGLIEFLEMQSWVKMILLLYLVVYCIEAILYIGAVHK